MILQITLGTALIILSVLVSVPGILAFEMLMKRVHPWLTKPPYFLKLGLILIWAMLTVMWMITAGIWVWAFAFQFLGIFPTLEEALYFSLVAFTTLGFGDILLPMDWRLLGGMCAASGLLNIGMMTAFLMEVLRQVRRNQRDAFERDL